MRILMSLLLAVLRRARKIVRRLLPWLYEPVMDLYRSSPALQASVQGATLRQELDILADLVTYGTQERLLAPRVAVRLKHYVQELRDEAFAAPGD